MGVSDGRMDRRQLAGALFAAIGVVAFVAWRIYG